jgi:hypothetical protein
MEWLRRNGPDRSSRPFEIGLNSDRNGWERTMVKLAEFPDGDVKALITGLAFSPDGKRIAYTRLSLDKYVIWTSPVTGGPAMRLREEVQVGKGDSLEQLTKGAWAKMKNVHLKWSPSGDWIATDMQDGLTLVALDSDASRVLNSQRYAAVELVGGLEDDLRTRKEGRKTLICSVDVAMAGKGSNTPLVS